MRAQEAWGLREQLREHRLAPKRIRHCGKTAYRRTVALVATGAGLPGRATWWDGVVRCRSRTCPVCWVARRARAAETIKYVTDAWLKAHPAEPTYLTTFTIRHQAGDPVSLCRDVRKLWRLLLQRRKWRGLMAEHGAQWIAAEEVTAGDHGWHPHIHCFLLVERALPDYLQTADDLYEAWSDLVALKLGPEHAPDPVWGVDLRPCPPSRYLTKLGIELTDAAGIKGRAPLALLQSGQLDRYMTLQVSRNRSKDVTYSKGLRELRDSQPSGSAGIPFIELTGSQWHFLARLDDGMAPLAVVQAGSPFNAHAQLRHYLGTWLGDPLEARNQDAAE